MTIPVIPDTIYPKSEKMPICLKSTALFRRAYCTELKEPMTIERADMRTTDLRIGVLKKSAMKGAVRYNIK